MSLLKKHHYDLERMAHEETDAQVLNSIDSESTNPIPVIYQSGYLTIKGYDEEFGIYRLGFPNREVEEGFVRLKFRSLSVKYVPVIMILSFAACRVSLPIPPTR